MNLKILCSLTATLLITALNASPSNAGQPDGEPQSPKPNQDPALARSSPSESSTLTKPDVKLGERSSQNSHTQTELVKPEANQPEAKQSQAKQSEANQPQSIKSQSSKSQPVRKTRDVIKVGERQSSTASQQQTVKIHAHDYEGRQAATLYVRNIPVLTFLGSAPVSPSGVKLGTQAAQNSRISIAPTKSLATSDASIAATEFSPASDTDAPDQDDPVWRASALAAQLNQMSQDSIDAGKITVSWVSPGAASSSKERYQINLGDTVLATVDSQTILPNTTRNLETDALAATNLIRRLMGNAAPLSDVAGKPKPPTIAIGPIRLRLNGFASWYGPGFDGNASASGEIFDQEALTAAHLTLPFGTRVRVTNLDNGSSVVVRINDRGPYADDRVIDLSAGAARVVGLIQAGVAPVRLDVIDDRQASLSK